MTYKSGINVWRLIDDVPRSGSFNMAADQVLFDKCKFDSKPIFRVYDWECPTISIGRNEKIDEDFNLEVCKNLRIPVIRRQTGGQSVLHGFDMTYSFVGGLMKSSFGGSVLENYKYIAKGFYRFFEKLDLNPNYYEKTTTGRTCKANFLCFSRR